MKCANSILRIPFAAKFLFLVFLLLGGQALARLDCSPVSNTNNDLRRTVAIASNLPGTGVHSMACGLAAVASKVTPIAAKVQPYNGPNAWSFLTF
ncbi:MAG TPA: hypothetical protein VMT22_04640 [Terriglobales bacterium]|jgi:hypothetical protein|nr:hypothetical protein [Terriglobales bacterium]